MVQISEAAHTQRDHLLAVVFLSSYVPRTHQTVAPVASVQAEPLYQIGLLRVWS